MPVVRFVVRTGSLTEASTNGTTAMRAGILKEFTGISDPYEIPVNADKVIDTGALSAEEAAQEIVLHLEREGYIGVNDEKQG